MNNIHNQIQLKFEDIDYQSHVQDLYMDAWGFIFQDYFDEFFGLNLQCNFIMNNIELGDD